jgi:hypothetical protein
MTVKIYNYFANITPFYYINHISFEQSNRLIVPLQKKQPDICSVVVI